jgi:hypothetical protein
MDACKLSIGSPTITASSIQATLSVSFSYSGSGSVNHDWNVTSAYRNSAGALSDRQTLVSTTTRAIPACNPVAKYKVITFTQPISVPISANGVPELTVSLRPNDFRSASGFKGCVQAISLVSFPKTDPSVSLKIVPGSAYINRATTFKVKANVKDTSPSASWQLSRATFTWNGNPVSVTFDGTNYVFSIRADAVTSVGSFPVAAFFSFNTPLGVRNRTVSSSVNFMDASRLVSDKTMFSSGAIVEDVESDEGLTFKGGWALSLGTSEKVRLAQFCSRNPDLTQKLPKQAQIPFNIEGKFKFLIELGLNYGFSSRGVGSMRFSASITAELSDILEASGGAQLDFAYTKEKGVWTPRERSLAGHLEVARIFSVPNKKLPKILQDRLTVELKIGGGLRAYVLWKSVPYNGECNGGSGNWRRCSPVSLVPYLFATASARIGGKWAGAEAYGSIEMSATINISPFSFGGLGFNFKVGIRVWATFVSFRLEYSKTFCVLGSNCRKRDFLDDYASDPVYSIPVKYVNPGVFFDTPLPAVDSDYVALDEYIDAFSSPVLRSTSLTHDFAMAVYSYRPADDSSPQNPRLRAVWIESAADNTTTFSAPADIAELFNAGYADSSPALAWLPKTDREYILVWTRDTNASWVSTAPVVNGEVQCTSAHLMNSMASSQLLWAYFRPGRGWQIRPALTSGSTFSNGAQLSDSNLIHPVNQPILLAYEESQPWAVGTDIMFNNTFVRIRKFDASSIEMSAPASLSWPLSGTATGLIVRSYGRSHLVGYLLKESGDISRPYLRFAEWDTTAAAPTTPSINAQSGADGIALPACPNNVSATNLFASAWPMNLNTESFAPSTLRFLVGYTCDRSMYVGFVDTTSFNLPSFQKLSEDLTSDVSSIAYSQNGTHISFIWYGREVETKKSSYYIKTLPFAQSASWPPTFAMFNNAPVIRRARVTAQEDSFSAVYMQGPFLATLSSDSLYDKNSLNLADNETASVVSRRLVGAVVDLTLPSQPIRTINCSNAELMVTADGIEGSWLKASCVSAIDGPVSFEVRYGQSYSEDQLVGADTISLNVGSNDIMVRVDIQDLSGGSLSLNPVGDVDISISARTSVPIPATDLGFVVDSTVQVGTSAPVQIDTIVINRGLLPSGFVVRAYSDADGGILVGEIADSDLLTLNTQRSKSMLLWGLQTPGDYSVRLVLFESVNDVFPAATQIIYISVVPQTSFELTPSAVSAQFDSAEVTIDLPAGPFSPQSIRLIDLSANQEVDSIAVADFTTQQTQSLNTGGRAGPFAVVYGPDYATADAEHTTSRLAFIPVRPTRFAPVFNQTGAEPLQLSVPRLSAASNMSLARFSVRVPQLASPWGVVVSTSPASGAVEFTVSVSEFVPAALPTGAIRSQRLGSSQTFAAFIPFSGVSRPQLLNIATSVAGANLRTSASLAQFIAVANSTVTSYVIDTAAPVFVSVSPTSSGDLRLSSDRDYSAVRVFVSTSNFVLGSNQGGSEIFRVVSRALSFITTNDEDDQTGFVNTTTTSLPRIRTTWSVPVVAGTKYFVSMIPSSVGGGVFSLDVDTSSISVAMTSSCSINPLSSERAPSVALVHHQATNFTEVQVVLADEDVSSTAARLDDVVVTFAGPAGHCDFRLRDPLMNALWTVSEVQGASGCRKLRYSKIIPIDAALSCLLQQDDGSYAGSAQVERSYLIPASLLGTGSVKRAADGQTYSSYFSTSYMSLQVLQPAAPVAPPVAAPVNPPQRPPVAPPVAAPVASPLASPAAAPVEPPMNPPMAAPVAAPVLAPAAVAAPTQSSSSTGAISAFQSDPAVIGLLSFLVIMIILILIAIILVIIYVRYYRKKLQKDPEAVQMEPVSAPADEAESSSAAPAPSPKPVKSPKAKSPKRQESSEEPPTSSDDEESEPSSSSNDSEDSYES